MRPASDSELWRRSCGEALPSTRNRVRTGRRSASTLRLGNSSGRFCTSSSITNPRRPPNASMGSARRATAAGSSRSKRVTSTLELRAMAAASVVLPTCRAPNRPTTGNRPRSRETVRRWNGRSITLECYLEISVFKTAFSRLTCTLHSHSIVSEPLNFLFQRIYFFGPPQFTVRFTDNQLRLNAIDGDRRRMGLCALAAANVHWQPRVEYAQWIGSRSSRCQWRSKTALHQRLFSTDSRHPQNAHDRKAQTAHSLPPITPTRLAHEEQQCHYRARR